MPASRYQTLIEISECMVTHQQVATLLPALISSLKNIVHFDAITMTLYNSEERTITLYAAVTPNSFQPPLGRIIPVEDTPASVVLETGEPFYVPDLDADDRFPVVHGLMRAAGARCYVILAMSTARHRFLGSLNFGSIAKDAYSPDDIAFMRQVARLVGIAFENALNYEAAAAYREELARERDHLRILVELNNAIAKHLDTAELVSAVSNCLRTALRIDDVGIALLSENGVIPDGLPLISRGRTLGAMTFPQEHVQLGLEVAGQVAIALDNAQSYEKIERLNARLAQEKLYLEDEIRTQYRFEEIIGRSGALMSVLRNVETVAPSDSAVVISGETGTGKELIARAIHDLSARRNNTFVRLNCAAIPTGLLESELFGHEKGAFTGAIARRVGRFELAHGGTLFLDEVGEIPLELQPKLLRVLQEQEFERLGSSRTIKVDVRIVAATNRDLLQLVRERKFRDDLYYRLNVFPIHLPPLRDRREDIPLLVRHFAAQCSRRMRKEITSIPSETMDALTRYAWPGNVRELQNFIERAVIISSGSTLEVALDELRMTPSSVRESVTLQDAERAHIVDALRSTNWTLAGPDGAAARLGMKRSTLQFRMKKLGISRTE